MREWQILSTNASQVHQNQQSLLRFFKAENARDWQRYASFLSESIIWQLFPLQGSTEEIAGKSAYIARMQKAYCGYNGTFRCISLEISEDGTRLSAFLLNAEGERSLDIFKMQDGSILREWEFLFGK